MTRFDDVDYRRAFKEAFNGKTAIAEQRYEEIVLISDVDAEVASEMTQVLNVLSTASTIGASYYACMDEIDKLLLKKLDTKYVLSLIHQWLELVITRDNKIKDNKIVGAETDYPTLDDDPVHSWDEYFFNVARQAARNSKCFSRRIGAVVVKDKSIVSTGYNSPPRGVPTCDQRWNIDKSLEDKPERELKYLIHKCPRQVLGYKSGEGMELCPASHAEESAIVNCARMGICTKGASLYLTCGIPCSKCAVKIINSGIEEVIVTGLNQYDQLSQYLFDHSTVKIRVYDFI